MDILKQAENGVPVPELCQEQGMSSAKFGGMDTSLMSRLKELEEENRRLKKRALKGRGCSGNYAKKVVKPSKRKEMAQHYVASKGLMIKLPVLHLISVKPVIAIKRNKPKPLKTLLKQYQVWSVDFIHDQLSNRRNIRLFNVIDVFKREGRQGEVFRSNIFNLATHNKMPILSDTIRLLDIIVDSFE